MMMNDIKFFDPGQLISKRSLISTVIGIGLAVVTEWLIPWLGVMPIMTEWITPAVITFTIAIIVLTSALAKNIVASIIIALASALSFYNPYSTQDYGYFSLVVVYLTIALFSGFFAAREMTGQGALRLIGIIFGLQTIIGAGINLLLSTTGVYETFYNNGVSNLAIGNSKDVFPYFDVIVASVGLLYIIVFMLIGSRVHSSTINNKAREIIGQIIIFLAIAGALVVNVLFNETFTQETARNIVGENNLVYLNSIFQKTTSDNFAVLTLLNVFYVLPVVGMAIGIGLALITYQRAEGTTGRFRFNLEGTYFALNIAPALVIGVLSYYWYELGVSTFYLNMETWYILFTIFTNLLLVNLVVVFILALIIRPIIKSKEI
ncbi:MAG: hypothetical protein ACTSQE_11885 [Candidatus Heimdallarchaeaceae archaeon]